MVSTRAVLQLLRLSVSVLHWLAQTTATTTSQATCKVGYFTLPNSNNTARIITKAGAGCSGWYADDSRVQWSKVVIDLSTLRLDATNHHYARLVAGSTLLSFGTASACNRYHEYAEAVIDLRGTPFKVDGNSSCAWCAYPSTLCTCSQWTVFGTCALGVLKCQDKNQYCQMGCGGLAGKCTLTSNYLQLAWVNNQSQFVELECIECSLGYTLFGTTCQPTTTNTTSTTSTSTINTYVATSTAKFTTTQSWSVCAKPRTNMSNEAEIFVGQITVLTTNAQQFANDLNVALAIHNSICELADVPRQCVHITNVSVALKRILFPVSSRLPAWRKLFNGFGEVDYYFEVYIPSGSASGITVTAVFRKFNSATFAQAQQTINRHLNNGVFGNPYNVTLIYKWFRGVDQPTHRTTESRDHAGTVWRVIAIIVLGCVALGMIPIVGLVYRSNLWHRLRREESDSTCRGSEQPPPCMSEFPLAGDDKLEMLEPLQGPQAQISMKRDFVQNQPSDAPLLASISDRTLADDAAVQKKYHFFVSHKKTHSIHGNCSEHLALHLHDMLENMGWTGFLDVDKLKIINQEEICRNVRESCAMIVVFSDETIQSEWCRFEWKVAALYAVPVICVIDLLRFSKKTVIDQVSSASPNLMQHQWVEYTDAIRKDTVHALAEWLTKIVQPHDGKIFVGELPCDQITHDRVPSMFPASTVGKGSQLSHAYTLKKKRRFGNPTRETSSGSRRRRGVVGGSPTIREAKQSVSCRRPEVHQSSSTSGVLVDPSLDVTPTETEAAHGVQVLQSATSTHGKRKANKTKLTGAKAKSAPKNHKSSGIVVNPRSVNHGSKPWTEISSSSADFNTLVTETE